MVLTDTKEEPEEQRQAAKRHALDTVPVTYTPHGTIPNTPLAVSTISFILGSVFSLGLTFLSGGIRIYWWTTYQLGFFVAAWAAFHWGEFAVTAGWNLEKCSVDCSYLPSSSSWLCDLHALQRSSWITVLYIMLRMELPSSNIYSRSTSDPRSKHIHMFLPSVCSTI
jgi:protein-S-isoprenylcysteine O-methyltransferase